LTDVTAAKKEEYGSVSNTTGLLRHAHSELSGFHIRPLVITGLWNYSEHSLLSSTGRQFLGPEVEATQ
jgi:hypothetical protein